MADQKFTAIYPEMIVHRAGCADIAKVANRQADTTVTRVAASLADFLAGEVEGDLDDMGYTARDFNVKPCARRTRDEYDESEGSRGGPQDAR